MGAPLKRSDIYESIFHFHGEPFSFDDFPYWRDVVNSPRLTTNVDQLYRQQVWMCSRQVGKTVTLSVLGMGLAIEYNNINVIITQPTDPQISKFSVENLKPLEQGSVLINEIYKDTSTTQSQVKNKSYTTGSRIILGNIYSSVLSARGTPGSITIIDEYQNTPTKNADIVINGMRRSPLRFVIYSGTPLELENDIQIKFENSTGCEWTVKCPGCGHYNIKLGIKNVGKKGLVCERCYKRIDPRMGFWVEARPDMPVEGFRVNELCVPRDAPGATEWSKLLWELEGGASHSDRTIYNEILGESYSDNAYPINRQDILSWCDPTRKYIYHPKEITQADKKHTFAGLDWAMEMADRGTKKALRSYTMLTIGRYDINKNKIAVLFVKRYRERLYDKPEEVIKDIIYWLRAFSVKVICMDYGVGHKENQRIADIYGHKHCMEVEYTGELDYGMVYHAITNKFCVDRNKVFDDTIADMRRGMFELAKFEGETSEYEKDLTTVYRYHDADRRRTKYGKSQADDFFQNLVYVRLAALFVTGRLVYTEDA